MVHDDGMVNATLHCAIEDISAAATIIDVLHNIEKDIMVRLLVDDSDRRDSADCGLPFATSVFLSVSNPGE